MEAEQQSGAPGKVSVITRAGDAPPEETVASEARKGYDLLVIGIENVARKAEFHEDVNRIAAEFEGPLAIVAARGAHLERPLQSALNILVPNPRDIGGWSVGRRKRCARLAGRRVRHDRGRARARGRGASVGRAKGDFERGADRARAN